MRNRLSTLLLTSAIVLFYHFAATTALGQSAVFGPKKYIRDNGQPQAITDTFAVENVSGPFFITVQNGGDGEGGASSAIIELNGIKIFGPSDFNNHVALLRKSVSLKQQNTISVEVRGKPRSAVTITIRQGTAPPTSTQYTVFTNPTDPQWLREETPEGDVIDFYGERDEQGLPTTLYGVNVTRANGDEVTFYLDDQGRPTLIGMPNGVTFSIQWQSDTFILLTAFFNYGDSQVTVPINLATQSAGLPAGLPLTSSLLSQASLKLPFSALQSTSSLRAHAQIIPRNATTVKVTLCGVPVNNAFVRIPVEGRPGPPILARPIGGGVYIAGLPIPPPNFARPINRLCNSIQQRISEACDRVLALKLGGVQTGMICDAILGAAPGEPDLEVLGGACKIGFGALSVLCSVAKPCAKATAYLDRAISAPITYRPIATLYGITKCGDPITAPSNGPFPTLLPIDFPCACQSGLGTRLFSTGRNIQIAVVPPEADFTDDIRLSSPVFRNIATNHYSGPPINIFSYRVGAELIFSIYVQETGQTFFTGPGSRNPDGLAHAKVSCLSNGRARVSFEDYLGGGDNDFDDAVFEITSGDFQGPICR
jgi:hypothetical protein